MTYGPALPVPPTAVAAWLGLPTRPDISATLLAKSYYVSTKGAPKRFAAFYFRDDVDVPIFRGYAWLEPGRIPDVEAELSRYGRVHFGKCDAEYLTPFRHAWWEADGRLNLVTRRKRRICTFEVGGTLRLRYATRADRNRIFPHASGVRVDVSNCGTVHVLRLVRRGATNIRVSSRFDPFPLIDPTYDALDLWCDAYWAIDLARDIGRVCGIPVDLDEALQ